MKPRDQHNHSETTHERPSSFREMLYRDRRLVSRRQMDRLLRDRAAERAEPNTEDEYPTYFPALRRVFSGGPDTEIRAVLMVVVLVVAAFLFGRWVGSNDVDESPAQSAAVVLTV